MEGVHKRLKALAKSTKNSMVNKVVVLGFEHGSSIGDPTKLPISKYFDN